MEGNKPDELDKIVETMEKQSSEQIKCGSIQLCIDRYKTQSGEPALRIRSFAQEEEN